VGRNTSELEKFSQVFFRDGEHLICGWSVDGVSSN